MKKLLFLYAFIAIFSISAFADIRLPDNVKPSPTATPRSKTKSQKMQMSIRVNPNIEETTLVIPRGAINNLRAQLDELDGGNSNVAQTGGISGTQTLMSGMFFSAALIFGGVWMFRGKSLAKNQKIIAGLLIFAFLGASVYTVSANVAPPAYVGIKADVFSDKMRTSWRGAVGEIKVEVDEDSRNGGMIELWVPRSDKSGKTEE